MDNISKITIDDSSTSMYFSFNSTTAYKMNMESANENSMCIEDEDECDQNNTLEADGENQPSSEEIQTIKKLSLGISPPKAIPKNILKAYKALSSTPTKAQLLRSVEVNRGSAAVDVGDLGLAFLEAPQESINAVLSEDKENQPQESQEIVYSETSSEIVVSVIEKTQEEAEKPLKRVGFSNLPVLKCSANMNIRGGTPKVRRSIPRHEPDLVTNRPSRINKRVSTSANARSHPTIESDSDEIPKMLSSILKISKGLQSNRKSIGNADNPFNLLGKATRMSIVKTTLNSPARKVSRKSLTVVQVGKNSTRLSNLPINKGKTIPAPSTATTAAARRSVIPTNFRKSIVPSSMTSPKKRIVSLNSRKSMILPMTSSWNQNPTKMMVSKPSTSDTMKNKTTLMKPPSGIKEDLICEICSRKFLVLSLFEAHKRTHNKTNSSSSSLTKQSFSSGNDNKCRYCDKKFAIAKALENHLIEKCTKIPPGDKKKLLFPPDQHINMQSKSKLPPKSLSNLSSCDSLSSNTTQLSRSQFNAKISADGSLIPSSSNNKLKKKLAHSGVYCTPNKQIICHICKTSFNNILAFTEHKLSHSNATTGDGDCAIETEPIKTYIDVENDGKVEQQIVDKGDVHLK